jgi:hypothetical protein
VVAIPVVFGLDLQLYRLAGRNSAQLEELFAAFGRELDDRKGGQGGQRIRQGGSPVRKTLLRAIAIPE